MIHLPRTFRQQKQWFAALLLVTAASLAILFFVPAQARDAQVDGPTAAQLGNSQIFNDDLTVDEGELISSNVVLYDGDAKVKDGGRIAGNLVVYSGDIEIREGGTVTGDVSAFSGDIKIKGTVEGDVASWSGDVELDKHARVEGDISVLSGDIKRHDSAYVGGNVVRGPSFNLKVPAIIPPLNPGADVPSTEVVVATERSAPGFLERIGNMILRLMVGFGITIIFVPLAGLIAYSKPDYVGQVEGTIKAQTALAFAIGLLTNVIGGLLIAFLAVTICLIPVSALLFFLLIGLNLIGLTAISGIVGKRIGRWLKVDSSHAVRVILGALTLSAVIVPFFALGGCFRFIAFVGILLIGAFGAGGVVVSWSNRRSGRNQLPPPTAKGAIEGPTNEPEGPVEPMPTAPVDPDTPADVEPVQEDDFTEISGVNAVMDARLKVAGVRTFADLASMTPEAVADIFSWTPEEVQSEQIIEKAQVLAGIET